MFDFSIVTSWIHGLLTSWMPVELAVFLECVIVGVCLLLMYAVIAILMIFMERKVCAAFQCQGVFMETCNKMEYQPINRLIIKMCLPQDRQHTHTY